MPEGRPAALAYVGLGANLGDPAAQVRRALRALAALPRSRLLAASPLYRTAPVAAPENPAPQPDYVNAAARLATRLTPAGLLRALRAIERRQGRRRDGPRWGPRVLDLDLLLYAGRVQTSPRLTLPHPELHRRAFVLVPLADIAPAGLVIPGAGPLAAVLAGVSREGVWLLEPDPTPLTAADRSLSCSLP